ncbi:MAG: HAD family phosphatase [Hyphomonadaceae bacterium]|nr:HAD family phosphatase [Clostridia bacterium]
MAIKLIAIDLDDTLLGHDLTISERNIKAIQKAQAKGIKVTLASGRATPAVAQFVQELNIDVPIITYQGSKVVDTQTGEILFAKEVSPEQAMPIVKFCEENDLHLNTYVGDVVQIEALNDKIEDYLRFNKAMPHQEVGKMSDWLKAPSTKLLMIDSNERLHILKPQIEALCDASLNVMFSKPIFLEIIHKQGTKGAGVDFLAKMYGFEPEEVMAIGDTYNDVSMITYAGVGVCMANGPLDVRMQADYVTLSNEADGVAFAIEKFALNSEA